MATPVSVADWADAINETTATFVAADLPIFGINMIAWDIRDLPAQSPVANVNDLKRKRFVITDVVVKQGESAGATKLLDQSMNAATPADGSTARASAQFSGQVFNHTASIVGTTAATVTSRPWQYAMYNLDDATVTRQAHQCLITNEAGIETYIAAQVANWTTST